MASAFAARAYGFHGRRMASRVRVSGLVAVRCAASDVGEDNGDRFYMRRCVELARKAVGCMSPNPMVGCVIVKDGKVVGEGFHPKAGQPHTEVFALRDAGHLAEKATAYVSLQPCNHYGRTPPCTEALIKAKVKKVIVGMVDPNPKVYSKGVDRLRAAGIEVTVGIEEELCKKLNEPFVRCMLNGKPFVSLSCRIFCNLSRTPTLEKPTMALLGEDGGVYDLARKLEAEGVWRKWLGDYSYGSFLPYLSSSSSWDTFMRSHHSLRVRALLFDKASVSLFVPIPSASALNPSYWQLQGDDLYYPLESSSSSVKVLPF